MNIRDYIIAAKEHTQNVASMYEEKITLCRKKLIDNLEKYDAIAIYGAGGHTKELIQYLKKNSYDINKIKCIINREQMEQKIEGISVYILDEALDKYVIDAIVISSLKYEDIMYCRLQDKNLNIDILRIYAEEDFEEPERAYAGYDAAGKLISSVPMDHLHRYGWVSGLSIGKDVVDMACGSGYGSAWLAEHANSVVGIDISEEAISYAKEHYMKNNLIFLQKNILEVNGDAKADVVVSFETIEHIDDEIAYFSAVKSVLKENGVFVVSTPVSLADGQSSVNQYHINEYTVERFKNTLESHFNTVIWYRQDEADQFAIAIDDGSFEKIYNTGAIIMLAVCYNK